MSTIELSTPAKLTAAELLAMPDEKDYELVNGQLEARQMGGESSWIAINLAGFLSAYCRQTNFGWVFGSDAGYQCFADDPQKVRRADVSVVSLVKIPRGQLPAGYIRAVPDLAVEVVSPNDLAEEINTKVKEYREAAVPLIWVIYPSSNEVVVYGKTGVIVLTSQDELSGEKILPGFQLSIAELFRKPGE